MAFDTSPTDLPVPVSFGALYEKWRSLRVTGPTPILEFVAWVETTLGTKIGDLATDEDLAALGAQLVADAGDGVGEMLWQGLEGGP